MAVIIVFMGSLPKMETHWGHRPLPGGAGCRSIAANSLPPAPPTLHSASRLQATVQLHDQRPPAQTQFGELTPVSCIFVFCVCFSAEIAFSGFLLGNHKNLGVAANFNISLQPAKMSGA